VRMVAGGAGPDAFDTTFEPVRFTRVRPGQTLLAA